MYNSAVGITAATIFLTASTFYYFSLTPYGFELLIGAVMLLALSVYRIFVQRKQEGVYFGIVSAVYFGIRPQETFLIGPLAMLGFAFLNKKQKLIAAVAFTIITFLWLIPLIQTSGGLNSYIDFNLTALRTDVFNYTFKHNLELVIKGFLLTFGLSCFFLLYYLFAYFRKKNLPKNRILIFYALWIIPGILFNLFVRAEHAGYQISYLGGFIILVSYAIWKTTKKSKLLYWIAVLAIAVFNLYWFFYDRDPNYIKPYRPSSFHYSDIRKNDLKVGSKVEYVQKNFNSDKTLLITTDAMWRPYSYYLKSYRLIGISALSNIDTPYAYSIFEGYNWDIKGFISEKFEMKIPENIEKIVFMEDEAYKWIKSYPYKKIDLPGNSKITVISVPANSKLIYDYHSIRIK